MNHRLFLFLLLSISPLAKGQCLDSLIDLPGGKWRDASSQADTSKLKMHSSKPSMITIHYTGVKKNFGLPIERKLKGLVNFSKTGKTEFKKELWGDMPYNYYIDANGKSAEGRDPRYRPDTNTSYNPDGHVTIVVEGTLGDDLSPAQKQKMFSMIKALQNKYGIPTSKVGVHKHYASTSCPGPEIEAAIKEYKKEFANFKPSASACNQTPARAVPRPASTGSSGGLDDAVR